MTQWHMKGGRKVSGGKIMTDRRSDKRLAWKGGDPSLTTIVQEESGIVRESVGGMGGTGKVKLKAETSVIVHEGAGKAKKLKILTVAENNANSQFARQNIITKGAVLKVTDGGKEIYVKVTSRPGQGGQVSGMLLRDYVPKKEEASRARKEKSSAKPAKAGHKKAKKAES